MNLFRKLFGRKAISESSPAPEQEQSAPAATNPGQDPNLIRVFDGYGREMFITRDEWRKNVLPGTIEKVWDKPDELFDVLANAITDGFRTDVLQATEHLYKTDTDRLRAAQLWGILLREEGRLDEAERVFHEYTTQYGDAAPIVANLGRIHLQRDDIVSAERSLRQALELDPNLNYAIDWYQDLSRQTGGDSGGLQALQRVAELPGSWRAVLMLARHELQSGRLDAALQLYDRAFARAGEPAPTDLLMQVSGDLGMNGHVAELLRLTTPRFNAESHGLSVGNNLIKANVETGRLAEAKQILESLYAQKRPDWAEALRYWETEIDKKRVAQPATNGDTAATTQEQPRMSMLRVEGPVWLPKTSPATSLFPAAGTDAPLICFLGSSAETGQTADGMQQHLSDGPGRMSRALPLFLAEQTALRAQARTRTLIPLIVFDAPAAGPARGGFALFGEPWADAEAAPSARSGTDAPDVESAEFMIVSHVIASGYPWHVRFRLLRTIDATRLAEWEDELHFDQLQDCFGRIVSQAHAALAEHAAVQRRPSANDFYAPPTGADGFSDYLLRLEQLLAVRCTSAGQLQPNFLNGEREIFQGCIRLCVEHPQSVSIRILLAQLVAYMRRIRPNIVEEFAERLALLNREHPPSEQAAAIVQSIFDQT